jgi:hypothetical protein
VHEKAHREMAWTLATNRHLTHQEAFQIIESFCDA